MSTKYKAVEVTRPGVFTLTERPLTDPPAGQVRLRVEACGVCHSDSGTVDAVLPGITYLGKFSKTREDVKTWFEAIELDDYASFGGKA